MQTTQWRRWLQFRLSTAVVLMFAAGVLIMLNCAPKSYAINGVLWGKMYGWPWPMYYDLDLRVNISCPQRGMTAHKLSEILDFLCSNIGRSGLRPNSLAADLGIHLAILFAIAVICEWPFRVRNPLPSVARQQ